jgi:hypothetical protein
MPLTPQGSQAIEELARRYYVSVDAVMTLLQAVINGGGTMAQFSHPDLGGSGQWMQGGMTMVGDMFNNALKAKVDQLCSELAGLAATQTLFAPPAPGQQPRNASLSVPSSGSNWWPADLGTPSSTGSQNNVRYAVFPSAQRLVIEINGQIAAYDTMNNQIGGVSQQQGADASVTFTSQFGLVRLIDLPIIPDHGAVPAPVWQTEVPAPAERQWTHDQGDVFANIEHLAELRQKGILSEEEFSSKKAELLSRL